VLTFFEYLRQRAFESIHQVLSRAVLRSTLRWVGEDHLPQRRPMRQRPDAIVLDTDGRVPPQAIEYGGDYAVERLVALHTAPAGTGMSYETW